MDIKPFKEKEFIKEKETIKSEKEFAKEKETIKPEKFEGKEKFEKENKDKLEKEKDKDKEKEKEKELAKDKREKELAKDKEIFKEVAKEKDVKPEFEKNFPEGPPVDPFTPRTAGISPEAVDLTASLKDKAEFKQLKLEKVEFKENFKQEVKELQKLEKPEKEKFEKEWKDFKEGKDKFEKEFKEGKEIFEGPDGGNPIDPVIQQQFANIESSVSQLRHFITQNLRPDLSQGALTGEEDVAKKSDGHVSKGKAGKPEDPEGSKNGR